MIERLPEQCEWRTMPNQMIEYCGYTHGKMSVKGALIISGHARLLIKNWFGCGYT